MLTKEQVTEEIINYSNQRKQRIEVLQNNDPVVQNLNGRITVLSQILEILNTESKEQTDDGEIK